MMMTHFLQRIEAIGNRLPHPTAIFAILCVGIAIISAISYLFGLHAVSPVNGDVIYAKNILSIEGLNHLLTSLVKNFVTFAPVGTVLVATLGLGIADHSGLLSTSLQALVKRTPSSLLVTSIVFCGVLSSLAADAGYVVLIPLAGLIFLRAGKHPIAGIAAAFAGVSGGYSANIVVGPLDAILAGISQESAQLIDSQYSVAITSNYYFLLASTALITIVASLVCLFVTQNQTQNIPFDAPSADHTQTDLASNQHDKDKKGLKAALAVTLALVVIILAGFVPESGFLRSSEGGIIESPFMRGIVVVVAFWAGLAGLAFGLASGRYQRAQDAITGMERHIATLSGYLVLMFFAAQFIALFSWSELGIIIAIAGATLLKAIQLPLPILLITFVFLAAFINLLIGSASAKWALLAPIFVPMLLLLGITPEATQMAFRIGDSTTNIITPLMPYFGVVIAFMQHYNQKLGAGTIIAVMLPYSIALFVSWLLLLLLWVLLDLPLGPGASAFIQN